MHSVINLEEKIGKTVGRRFAPKDSFTYGMELQQTIVNLGKEFGHSICPKGVYRFATHEEADEWMRKMMSRPKEVRTSKVKPS